MKLRVKARSDFEQTCDAPLEQDPPLCWLGDTAQDLEQRTLAGSIATNDTDGLAVANLEANIPERPEFLDFIALNDLSPMNNIEQLACEIAEFMSDDVPQGRVFEACWLSGPVSDQVAFGQIFDGDGRLRHPIWSATLSLSSSQTGYA